MKKYRFAVHNMNNPYFAFWFYKEFSSSYAADRYAMRVSFQKKNSLYLVCFIPE